MLRPCPLTTWQRENIVPSIAPDAHVDETALLIGAVTISSGVIICPYAVLRADEGFPITIGENSNVQDGVIIHALLGTGVEIAAECSIAHGAIIHGPCLIGRGTFVGFRTTLFRTSVGQGCFIGHGAMVLDVNLPDSIYVPPGAIIQTGTDVERLSRVPNALKHFPQEVLTVNAELRRGYRQLALEEKDADRKSG